jgi:hypothetical protein
MLRIFDCGSIDVAPMRLDRHSLLRGKFGNTAHDITAAARYIKNSQRSAIARRAAQFPNPAPDDLRGAADRIRRSQRVERAVVHRRIEPRLIH